MKDVCIIYVWLLWWLGDDENDYDGDDVDEDTFIIIIT